MPPGGAVDGVEWIQSMSRITLSYQFSDTDVSQDDIVVKLAGFQIEVLCKGDKVKALTGELQDLVKAAPLSWWILSKDEGGPPTIAIQLLKLKHGAWGGPWYVGQLHPRRKGRFFWTAAGKQLAEKDDELIKLNKFEEIAPGRPKDEETAWYPPTPSSVFTPISDKYLCSPDDIVLGTHVTQDNRHIWLSISFDYQALSYFSQEVPYEDLFAADIGQNSVYVFIRGDDQNPIINATLAGYIYAESTTWKMTTDDTYRKRQKATDSPCQVLLITMTKAEGYTEEWPQIFQACWQHRLMVKNQDEYEDMIGALEELQWLDESAPETQRIELQEKADKLNDYREERFDGIPEAMTYRRSGYDLEAGDFWENVYDCVREAVNSNGYASGPKVLDVFDA